MCNVVGGMPAVLILKKKIKIKKHNFLGSILVFCLAWKHYDYYSKRIGIAFPVKKAINIRLPIFMHHAIDLACLDFGIQWINLDLPHTYHIGLRNGKPI